MADDINSIEPMKSIVGQIQSLVSENKTLADGIKIKNTDLNKTWQEDVFTTFLRDVLPDAVASDCSTVPNTLFPSLISNVINAQYGFFKTLKNIDGSCQEILHNEIPNEGLLCAMNKVFDALNVYRKTINDKVQLIKVDEQKIRDNETKIKAPGGLNDQYNAAVTAYKDTHDSIANDAVSILNAESHAQFIEGMKNFLTKYGIWVVIGMVAIVIAYLYFKKHSS